MRLFDSPPLAPVAPVLAEKILAIRVAFREGKVEKTQALTAFQAVAENYRLDWRD